MILHGHLEVPVEKFFRTGADYIADEFDDRYGGRPIHVIGTLGQLQQRDGTREPIWALDCDQGLIECAFATASQAQVGKLSEGQTITVRTMIDDNFGQSRRGDFGGIHASGRIKNCEIVATVAHEPAAEPLKVDSADLGKESDSNRIAVWRKCRGRMINVTGQVRGVGERAAGLNMFSGPRKWEVDLDGVECEFITNPRLSVGQTVTIEGSWSRRTFESFQKGVVMEKCKLVGEPERTEARPERTEARPERTEARPERKERKTPTRSKRRPSSK